MTMPGFVTNQPLSGQGVGQAIFQLLPTMPHESPIPMPRVLARQLFPGGFQPFRAAPTLAPPVALVPPAAPAAPPVVPAPPPVDANGNQILRRQPMPAASPAQPVVAAAPARARDASSHEQIHPTSQRVRIRERRGL